jgi:hypothetical protein
LIDKYEKHIDKLEKTIYKQEEELEKSIRALNEKEAKVFEVQKVKLEAFRYEIGKYENIYRDLEEKQNILLETIKVSNYDEEDLYNRTYMIYEDYLSFNNEIVFNKKKIVEMKETLNDIEKTYPKEFEFLLEDIRLEKEMNEIVINKSNYIIYNLYNLPIEQINSDIYTLEKNKNDMVKVRESKTYELNNCLEEINKVEREMVCIIIKKTIRKLINQMNNYVS